MKLTREDKKIIIDLNDEEEIVIEHLESSRGIKYLEGQIKHWLDGRIASVKEELKQELIKTNFGAFNVRALKGEVTKLKIKNEGKK